jgi:AcrR family transcriptional regulator
MTMVTKIRMAPSSLRQRKKLATRARIIEVAIRIFGKRGMAAPTVEEIAAAAQVGKGTIYNYFANKEEIVVAFMVDLEKRVQAKLGHFVKSKAPLHKLLADFLLFQLRLKASIVEFDRVFLAHMFMHTKQFRPYMAEMQKSIDPVLEELFAGLQERGAIRMDVNLQDIILVFKTIHLGLSALWAIEGPPFQGTEKVIRQEMLLFSQGLERKHDR